MAMAMAGESGLEAIERRLAEVGARVRRAAAERMADNAGDLLLRAVGLAPVERGRLRAAGEVRATEDGNGDGWEVGFFGVEYAATQHERLDFEHGIGQAKFLEEPFVGERPRYVREVAAAVREALG